MTRFNADLFGSGPVLDEYIENIGGREKLLVDAPKSLKGKKRGRPTGDTPSGTSKRSRRNGEHPADSQEPASLKKEKGFKTPTGSWEDHVDIVDMYRDDQGALMVYLTWHTGHKTQHPAKQAYTRCPQKVSDLRSLSVSMCLTDAVRRDRCFNSTNRRSTSRPNKSSAGALRIEKVKNDVEDWYEATALDFNEGCLGADMANRVCAGAFSEWIRTLVKLRSFFRALLLEIW